MPSRYTPLLQYLRRLACPSPACTAPDAELLRRFVHHHDEAAFAALVARHGPLVLRVCGHVLGDTHAAEDCLQVVFLVLARRDSDLDAAQRHLDQCQALAETPEAVTLEWNLLQAQRGELSPAVEGYLLSCLRTAAADTLLIREALTQGYWKNRRLPEARGCVEDLLRQCPDHPAACLWHGEILERLQFPKEALRAYRRAVELDPESLYARLSLAELLLHQTQPAEAVTHFEFLHQRLPDNPAVRLGLAGCYRRLGRPEEARRLLDALLVEHGDEALILSERGRLALEQGELEQAETWLRRAVALPQGGDLKTYYALSQCLMQRGKKEEAQQYQARADAFEADLKLIVELTVKAVKDRRDLESRYQLALAYLRVGQEEGLGWLKGILHDAPHYAPAHEALADYYGRHDEPGRAAQHRRLAREAGPRPR